LKIAGTQSAKRFAALLEGLFISFFQRYSLDYVAEKGIYPSVIPFCQYWAGERGGR
jgi:hypothetical protein